MTDAQSLQRAVHHSIDSHQGYAGMTPSAGIQTIRQAATTGLTMMESLGRLKRHRAPALFAVCILFLAVNGLAQTTVTTTGGGAANTIPYFSSTSPNHDIESPTVTMPTSTILLPPSIAGTLSADQWQIPPLFYNGIANALTGQCLSMGYPYTCQIVAPAVYGPTAHTWELPQWAFVNFIGGNSAPQHGLTSTVTLSDQRFGGTYQTVLNPYTFYPGTTLYPGYGLNNLYVGGVQKTFYGIANPNDALGQVYYGQLFDCVHTQGGSLSQIYDNVNQSFLDCLNIIANRSTAEASFGVNVHYQGTSPGDIALYGGSVYGPAGYTHNFDEGMELASQLVSETINVYRGFCTSGCTSNSTKVTVPAAGTVTTWSGNGTTLTLSNSNPFNFYSAGQSISFGSCTTGLTSLNGTTQAITGTPTSTQFTIASSINTSGSSETCQTTVAGSGEDIAGTQGDGRYLLLTSSSEVGSFTPSSITGWAGLVVPGSMYSYFSSLTGSSSALSATSENGYLTTAVTSSNYGTPLTVGFVANIGTAPATGIACIADQQNTGEYGSKPTGNFEIVNITAVAGGTFTATFQKSHPVQATYWQGGNCGQFIELVSDTLPSGTAWSNGEGGGTTAYPVRYPYPVLGGVTSGGVTTLYVYTASSDAKQNYVSFGSAWQQQATKTAANLYYGAEVYSVAGVDDDLSDGIFTLSPNEVPFTSGASLEESHMYAQSASTGHFSMSQWSPSGGVSGPLFNYIGRMEYPSTGLRSDNSNSWTSYTNGGGLWTLPNAAYQALGPWMYGFFLSAASTAGGVPEYVDLLGVSQPSANATAGLIGFGYGPAASIDQFTYTSPYSRTAGGGTWGFKGNLNVTGTVSSQQSLNALLSTAGLVSGVGTQYAPNSNNLTASTWSVHSGSITVTQCTNSCGSVSAPPGGTTVFWQLTSTGSGAYWDSESGGTQLASNMPYSISGYYTGGAGGEVTGFGAGSFTFDETASATAGTWQYFCITETNTTASNLMAAMVLQAAQTIYVADIQTSAGSSCSQGIQTPYNGSYQVTTATAVNTINGSPIVTGGATQANSGGDMACAMAGDTTIHAEAITGGSSTATTITIDTANTQYIYVGQVITIAGAAPSGYNIAQATVTAFVASTSITVSSTNNPGAWTSGGTWSLACGNQSSDAITATPYTFSTQPSLAAAVFNTYPQSHAEAQLNFWTSAVAPNVLALELLYNTSRLYEATINYGQSGNGPGYGGMYTWSFNQIAYSSPNSTIFANLQAQTVNTNSTGGNFVNTGVHQPAVVNTSASEPLNLETYYAATGVVSGTYTSGGTISGSMGQTCTLTGFNDSSTAAATVALTGTNTIASGTALTITSRGDGATAAPTTATLGSGTATCSGTATISTVLGGAPGNAMLLNVFTWRPN